MNSGSRLAESYMLARPAAAARVLEQLPAEECAPVLAEVPSRVAAGVLVQMLPSHAGRCANRMAASDVAGIIERIGTGHAAVILRGVDAAHREQVFADLPGLRRRAIEQLLSYPPSMVGAWIEPSVFVLRDTTTYGEARKALRAASEDVTHRVFVLDERRRPVGAIDLAQLVSLSNRGPVAGDEPAAPVTVRARTSLAAARAHPDWRRHLVLPVVNRRAEFIGCLHREALEQALARSNAVPEPGLDSLGTLLGHGATGVWSVCRDLLTLGTR